MQFQKSLLTATLFAAASLIAVSANADSTVSKQFEVNIEIMSVCTVDATVGANDVEFGQVVAGTAATALAAIPLTVSCSNNTPYVVNLTPSNSNALGLGAMKGPGSGSTEIAYQLRKAPGAAAAVWGNNGTLLEAGNGIAGTGQGVIDPIDHIVYATVTATETDVEPGLYADTVTVAVTY